jgi:1-acyl-sn-glycerol-3-phosphate acyltransferase
VSADGGAGRALLGTPGSPRAWRLFELGFRPWMKRRLAGVHVAGLEGAASLPGEEPLLLVANHTSWYDGFLLREVHRRVRPTAPLRTLMLDSELRKAPVLRWIGGTGFDPDRPVTLRSALRELKALRRSGVAISFFPQGRIYPATRRPLGFRPGVSLLARTLAPLHVVPVAIHLEMGTRTRPTAWILAGSPVTDGASVALLEGAVTGLLDRVQRHLHEHGEGAAAHWPP